MPIFIPIRTISDVSVSYHRVTKINFDVDGGFAEVVITSYSDEQAAILKKPVASHWKLGVPMAAFEGAAPVMVDAEAALATMPGSPFLGGSVISDSLATLDAAKARKLAALEFICREVIFRGFVSSALGQPFRYPARQQDQANLAASVLDSVVPGLPEDWTTPFWAAQGDSWAWRLHTAAQIQQVGRDAKAAVLAAQAINEALGQQIAAIEAGDGAVGAVNAINWPQ